MERRRDGEMACVGRKGRSARGNRTATEGTHPGADRSMLAVREPHVTRRVKVKPRPRFHNTQYTEQVGGCSHRSRIGFAVFNVYGIGWARDINTFYFPLFPPTSIGTAVEPARLETPGAALASTALTRRAAADRPAPRERAGEVKEKSSPVKKERPRCSLCVYRAQPAAQSTDEALSAAAW